MDTRSRIIAIGISGADDKNVVVDNQSLVERLILFDQYVMVSARLQEIPRLVQMFGYSGVLELLRSGKVSLYVDAVTIGSIGQTTAVTQTTALPLSTFAFAVVRSADREQYLGSSLAHVAAAPGVGGRGLIKLKEAVVRRLIDYEPQDGLGALTQLETDLALGSDPLHRALELRLGARTQSLVPAGATALRLEQVGEREFRAEHSLVSKFGLGEEEAHALVQDAFLGVGALNQRLEHMERYSASTAFLNDELGVLDARLQFLLRQHNSADGVDQLRRVTALTGFPDVGAACVSGAIKLTKVVEIAQSDECKEFRSWLLGAKSVTDKEIEEAFGGLRAKLGQLASGMAAKTVRWTASTGAGLIPGIGTIAGGVIGLLDTFVLDRLLPKPHPISFLNKQYRSIFDRDKL